MQFKFKRAYDGLLAPVVGALIFEAILTGGHGPWSHPTEAVVTIVGGLSLLSWFAMWLADRQHRNIAAALTAFPITLLAPTPWSYKDFSAQAGPIRKAIDANGALVRCPDTPEGHDLLHRVNSLRDCLQLTSAHRRVARRAMSGITKAQLNMLVQTVVSCTEADSNHKDGQLSWFTAVFYPDTGSTSEFVRPASLGEGPVGIAYPPQVGRSGQLEKHGGIVVQKLRERSAALLMRLGREAFEDLNQG